MAKSAMLLAIDAGNSRLKWACWQYDSWQQHGAVASGAMSPALAKLATKADQILICCVSNLAKQVLAKHLKTAKLTWLTTSNTAAGIQNNYRPVNALGVDRWCALIGLHNLFGHGIVVLAGTAVTVDRLTPSGQYNGGLILPGRALMANALACNTDLPQLEVTRNDTVAREPISTKSAMRSGIIRAVAGAIASHHAACAQPNEPVVITGGDAQAIAALIPGAHVIPDLIFDGMRLAHPRI